MSTIKKILHLSVAPALGCTEPAAVALCAAAASSLRKDGKIEKIDLCVDPNIYKNGLAVAIPGARGAVGIDLAGALGAFCGNPHLKLRALESITEETLRDAKAFVRNGGVQVSVDKQKKKIFIRARITKQGGFSEAVIMDLHDNIVSLSMDGNPIENHDLLTNTQASREEVRKLEEGFKDLTLEELIALLDDLDKEDLDFIAQGVETNMKLAENGLTFGPGLGVGLTLERLVREGLLKRDMVMNAKILTSAASDARMSGVSIPAMTSAGSGNHGITAILPIWAVKDSLVCEDKIRVLKAIALSHVITAYIKAHTGRLTAVCGCSIAAGAGATAGITYLMGGASRHISGAIKNVVGDLAGVICDGAKAGCALKLATAAGNAVQSALFSLHGLVIKGTDGIVANSPEQTMKNLGELSALGMIETDRTILDIMIRKWNID